MPDTHDDLRRLLFSIAYRMLGSVVEAEDMVQETYVRYQRAVAEGTRVDDPKSYLCAVTTRLCIDNLRSARVRRESYVGSWLPEPLLTGTVVPDGARIVEDADSVSMAFLLVLERLTPVERAVFLRHDVFDYGYGEVAEIVARSEDNCRQLAVRARRHVREERRRTEINGAPGALVADANGGLLYAILLDVAPGGTIEAVRTVRNPAKLAHLGPVGDVGALLRSRGAGREG